MADHDERTAETRSRMREGDRLIREAAKLRKSAARVGRPFVIESTDERGSPVVRVRVGHSGCPIELFVRLP
jgi:hypothetical protein